MARQIPSGQKTPPARKARDPLGRMKQNTVQQLAAGQQRRYCPRL